MIETRKGIMRLVFLVGRWAVKVPRPRWWRYFLKGLLANMTERDTWAYWGAAACGDLLCPVIWCCPGGWLLVMRRAELLAEDEVPLGWERRFEAFDDLKADNIGKLDGRLVLIDYGT